MWGSKAASNTAAEAEAEGFKMTAERKAVKFQSRSAEKEKLVVGRREKRENTSRRYARR